MEILTEFHKKEQGTLVVVTHDLMIAEYSEKIFHIKDGRIVPNHIQTEKIL